MLSSKSINPRKGHWITNINYEALNRCLTLIKLILKWKLLISKFQNGCQKWTVSLFWYLKQGPTAFFIIQQCYRMYLVSWLPFSTTSELYLYCNALGASRVWAVSVFVEMSRRVSPQALLVLGGGGGGLLVKPAGVYPGYLLYNTTKD